MHQSFSFIETHLSTISFKPLLIATGLINLALSLSQILAHGVINNDGISYIKMAVVLLIPT
ncbi:MAG: hypothetical protein A6F71_04430 [Cycloclasticus sp. symbiont of Poecilosclerida sp. M]|nr:MAG: hypothetical protein A6F71_04430 [Cycloclasticus sp. symbiont of Poecilosclerida sp. M]